MVCRTNEQSCGTSSMNPEQARKETAMDDDTTTPWYKNEKYARYWKHYKHCFNWYQKHINTCKDIQRVNYDQDYEQYCQQWSNFVNQYHTFYQWWQYNQWHTTHTQSQSTPHVTELWSWHHSPRQPNHFPKEHPVTTPQPGNIFRPPKPVMSSKKQSKSGGTISSKKNVKPIVTQGSPKRVASCSLSDISTDSSSSNCKNLRNRRRNKKKRSRVSSKCVSVEGSKTSLEIEMEITEDMLQFFALSAKHKHERDTKRKEVEETEEDYINLSEASTKHRARCTAPTEQPGLRRAEEMKVLYGRGAAMVHGMETAMQLNFDRLCDKMRSKPWPNIPLNVKFH